MRLKHIFETHIHGLRILVFGLTALFSTYITFHYLQSVQHLKAQQRETQHFSSELSLSKERLGTTEAELNDLKHQDQYLINKALAEEIKKIHTTYQSAVAVYGELLNLQNISKKTATFEAQFAKSLTLLSDNNYASASSLLSKLSLDIKSESQKITSSFVIPENVAVKNTAPGSGYSRQRVDSDVGSFLVDIIAADLGSTRVIVDTASNETCHDNCPVAALGDYASRSGAFAGINGPYFCPASYPSCAGKANSFDTLLMNKNKVYFNSDNNVYSTVPAVIFSGSSARFVGASQEWGRDTGVDSVIAAQPMLLSGGNITYGGDTEAKRAGSGSRSFIGTKGSTVYIGIVHNANVAQVARVLKTMGLEYALNLDSGGSTALWSGGRYLVGPGRQTPFGILFTHK